MDKQKNQGVFVTNCFIAAGSTFFPLSKLQSKQTSDNLEYQRMIYKGKENGGRSITTEMKSSFPDPFPIDALAAFFSDNLKEEKLREAMATFSIPISVTPDRTILSKSLATQFQLLIQSDDDDVDDIVSAKYQQLLSKPAPAPVQRLTPLYPGDRAWLDVGTKRSYSLSIYDVAQHTWEIQNTGTQTWRGRKLVFANHDRVRPRAESNSIDIPDTPPGKDIKITTSIDARGFEGKFDCLWEMQDSDGNDCFPNNKRMFCIQIETKMARE